MDDCSGNRFGRHLIRGYYFNQMPHDLAKEFDEEYNLEADYIKHNLYKEPNPNAYLATFAKFLIQHKNHPFCKKLIIEERLFNFESWAFHPMDNSATVEIGREDFFKFLTHYQVAFERLDLLEQLEKVE